MCVYLTVGLWKLDHLGDCFGWQDGEEVGDEEEPVLLVASGRLGLHSAQRDALAIVGAASSPIDERRVEPVHVKVLIVNEETFSHSCVTIVVCSNIESKNDKPINICKI